MASGNTPKKDQKFVIDKDGVERDQDGVKILRIDTIKNISAENIDKVKEIIYDMNVTIPFNPMTDSQAEVEARCDAVVISIMKEIDKTFAKK
jgi:hypothetical protein